MWVMVGPTALYSLDMGKREYVFLFWKIGDVVVIKESGVSHSLLCHWIYFFLGIKNND